MQTAAQNGLTSANFDLHQNIRNEDARGVDKKTMKQIMKIMRQNPGVNFDEARMLWMQKEMFRKMGCDETGMPIDPKAITSFAR